MTFQDFLAAEKKTTSGIYLDNLTGVRALAVLWVLILHTWGLVGGSVGFTIPLIDHRVGVTQLIKMGEWGVDIFFVLSGFLLTTPLIKAGPDRLGWGNVLHFYRRRALRILPAYYFALFALIYILLFGLGPIPTPIEMLQHTTFINVWLGTAPLRGAFWSLPVEALFYVLLPLFVLIAFRSKNFLTIFLLLTASTIAFRYAIMNIDAIQYKGIYLFSFFGRMDQFSIGAICAYLCMKSPATPRKGTLFLIIGIIGMLIFASIIGRRGNLYENRDYFYYFFQTITGLLAGAILYGAASSSTIARTIFGNRFMVFVGTISYSIYLWHPIVQDIYTATGIANAIIPENKLLAATLYTWPPILFIAFLSYLFIERPFLKIRHTPNSSETSIVQKYPIYFLVFAALSLVVLTAMARFTYQIVH